MRNKLSNFMGGLVKVILFASSYIPLYVIMIFQLWESSKEKIKNTFHFSFFKITTWNSILELEDIKKIAFLTILTIVLVIILAYLLFTPTDPNTTKNLSIREVDSINVNYITSYFSVYIFPFITLNFTTFNGMATMIILVSLIGYVYIKNDLVYINPILHLLFRYNIYEVDIIENNETKKVTILSKKSRLKLKTSTNLKFNKLSTNIWIEPHTLKKVKR
ncbi:hypothetical protein [Bacillus cereus group sp. Sample30]|uniref:hypothetical protein n=1 Tax=Bacillus cereus group sp. Sample30 TaxID=2816449 RepID=UPI002FDBC11D